MPNSLAELTDSYDPEVQDAMPVENPYRRVPVYKSEDIVAEDKPEGPSKTSVIINDVINKLFRDDDKRYQLWPEKVVRSALTAVPDAYSGKIPMHDIDPDTGETKPSMAMIERSMDMASFAGTGGLAGGVTDATLGSTPFLRPALKYKDKLYKGKEGQQHMDVIPEALYPEFQDMAMKGEDISHYNFGFVNDKGHFLDREKALKYGIDTGLIDPQAGKFGALTSTLMADSSKPGMAIEAMKASPFFSAVEHGIEKLPYKELKGEEWLSKLWEPETVKTVGVRDANNKVVKDADGKPLTKEVIVQGKSPLPGVKPEELDWTGLKSFLEENKGKVVTKEAIQEHLAANKVELKEVSKGGEKPTQYTVSSAGGPIASMDSPARFPTRELAQVEFNRRQAASPNAFHNIAELPGEGTNTKYHSYQLPGGENYREMLLTLPDATAPAKARLVEINKRVLQLQDEVYNLYKKPDNEMTAAERLERGTRVRELTEEKSALQKERQPLARQVETKEGAYKSSHWDEPNILAHVRMNDRTIDGKKSLHLEEIQSDWHQQGRDRGYKGNDKIDLVPLMDAQDATRKAYSKAIEDSWKKFSNGKASNYREARDLLPNDAAIIKSEVEKFQLHDKEFNKLQDAATKASQDYYAAETKARSGVPDAPFKKSWHELALKRMIREAAEKGYDRLSWTPGEAQAARYDLSKEVKNVYLHNPVRHGEKDIRGSLVATGHNGNELISKNVTSQKDIADLIGKEAAEKLVNAPSRMEGRNHVLEGKGLKVGGEGMKGFYDQILPKAIEKLGKEHGVKVKQGKTIITDPYKNFGQPTEHPIHYIDIPQSLRDTAMNKGFPLFSKGFMFSPVDYEPEFK